MKYASLLLVRADGLPVGYGSEGFPACTDGEGLKRYGKLVPGTYWLHNVELRASQYGQVDYQAPSRRIRVKVAPGRDNVVEVPLHAVQREQDEIKRRWPFIATGRATDGQGRPVAGVEVRACCGVGTLWPTGKCFTEKDGRYTLRFKGGVWYAGTKHGVSLQAATLFASKSGYYERNLCRHGGLGMTDREVTEGETRYYAGLARLGEPYRLDFVMLPAATIKGRIVDQTGRAVPGQKLYISGEELPPSSNVLSSATTDKQGRFAIDRVPLKPYWFELNLYPIRKTPRSSPVRFSKPSPHEVLLTYDRKRLVLNCKLVASPSTDPATQAVRIGEPVQQEEDKQ